MSSPRTSIHGQWSSRLAFILAATGSAVGLGNIWRFPYITGDNGGGAFVLVYLACIAIVGIPIMIAEVLLGRRGRQSPINTMRTLAAEEQRPPIWQGLGWMGVVGGFLILSFYSVVAGWTMAYVFRTGAGTFEGATADGVISIFDQFIADPERMLAWHTVFMVMSIVVVSRGVQHGLEKAVRYLMPALFLMLVGMMFYSMSTGAFGQAVSYLFTPDFSKFSWQESGIIALGQAFFSLSLGMGAIMIYGSYLPRDVSIPKMSVIVALMDTTVAIVAGLVIFPIVFAYGLEPGQGSGLVFKTLPIAFGQMSGGTIFGSVFFLLLVFAAWTSAISLLEPIVAWLVENRGMSRVTASSWAGLAAWLMGVAALLSLNIWSDFKVFGLEIFSLLEYITTNIMLPLGGLLIALFVGWSMRKKSVMHELDVNNDQHKLFNVWRFATRYIAPLGVLIIFLKVTGIFDWLAS